MATQSILRNSIVSPIRGTMQRTGSARSILKRPGVPLSPAYPFAASFSVQVSPTLRSPHVQFLPSPSLVSTFSTHSAASYDRAPISVSPLERTYVTSLEDFKLLAPPKPFRSLTTALSSPAITDFEDPRSPKIQPAAKHNLLRFATITSNQSVTRPSQTLAKALASYPRSPYPSAPLATPADYNDTDDGPTFRPRASSLELPKRNKKGLTLGSSVVPPTPSSLGRSLFSPSLNEGKKPAPLDLEARLSQAFWEALSLEEGEQSADEVMVTALEYPPSAVESRIMYADANGALWSPAPPKSGAAVGRIRESLMSPSKRSSMGRIVRKDFTAPTPNDPSAAFPSFATAMEMDSAITYPSRVALDYGV